MGFYPWGYRSWIGPPVATISLAPTTGVIPGSVITALDTEAAYIWTGSSWMELSGGGGGGGITSINADTTAAQALTVGTAGTDFAIVDAGSGSHVFNLPTASASNRGALSSADWSTFNGKQVSGNYITALTGDITASGPGSVAATLATVNSNVGTFAVQTVNAKGLVTAATTLTGDITSSGAATTLATVNTNVGSFSNASITVNAKGLVTAASNGTAPVTAVSVATANGLAGSSSGGATPALTLSTTVTAPVLAGNGTAISAGTTTGTGSTVVLAAGPTMTNPVVGTQSQGDSSTKGASTAYVDIAVANAISGINPAVAVQAATTTAANTSGLTYNNGASGIGATFTGATNTALTIDGFTFTAIGQRLLVKNDTQSPSGAFNGIYNVTQIQTSLLPPILTRALDYDTPSDINNTGAIPVVNGTVNGTTSWVETAQIVTVGTTPLVFAQFSVNPSTILTNPMTTANDMIIGGTAGTPTRLANGITGQVLTATTSAAESWKSPSISTINSSAYRVERYVLSSSGSNYAVSATSDTGASSSKGGTGKATITFGTAFSSAPSAVATVTYSGGANTFIAIIDVATGAPTTTQLNIAGINNTNAYSDCDGFEVIVMGLK